MRILSCLGVPVAQRPEDARVRVRFPEAGLSDEASKRTIYLIFLTNLGKLKSLSLYLEPWAIGGHLIVYQYYASSILVGSAKERLNP